MQDPYVAPRSSDALAYASLCLAGAAVLLLFLTVVLPLSGVGVLPFAAFALLSLVSAILGMLTGWVAIRRSGGHLPGGGPAIAGFWVSCVVALLFLTLLAIRVVHGLLF